MHARSALAIFVALLCWTLPAEAQTSPATASMQPPTYVIDTIRVEGVEDERTRQFVKQSSGLSVGQEVQLPSGDAVAQAVRSVYKLRLFSDVRIYQENETGSGNRVTLIIEVTPEPTLGRYRFEGIKGRHEDDIDEKSPLIPGRPVRPSDVERTKQVIKDFYGEKGYLRTEVDVERTVTADNRVNLTFNVDRNEKVEVERIRFLGNEKFDDGDLRGAFDETKENRWWRFWKGEKFKESAYEDDLNALVDFYNSEGYYDAQVVKDSVYFVDDDGIGIDVTVKEGNRYYVRSIDWEGNTVFPDRVLTERLGLEVGEPYNGKRMEENVFGNRKQTDILGLYMDRGYMRANVQPTVRVVGEDSLDISFDVQEGDVYTFGDIEITGNNKTKSHVIRRELYTVPGQRFSRSAIQESIRRLMQLSYFSQKSLAAGPDVNVDPQDKEADLTYNVEEVGSDQLELSGTFGQFGLVLQLGFQFNNFSAQNLFKGSAWRPLPSGDGQKLGLNIRTSGVGFQNYSLSFTEPWFRGKPQPIGGSVSYSRYTDRVVGRSRFIDGQFRDIDGVYQSISTNVFLQRRLGWPDDKFTTGTTVGYQFFKDDGTYINEDGDPVQVGLIGVGTGNNQVVTVKQSLSRNSLDNPQFPRRGSRFDLSLEVAPPIGELVQYHKWRLKNSFNVPIGDKFSIGVGADFGYIGSLTGEEVRFDLFEVGGTPFDYSGRIGGTFGRDPVFMRGYPQGVVGPVNPGNAAGARLFQKYTSEFRWMAVQSQQLQAQPYVFLDAANAWRGFDTYSPTDNFRSAGIGVKLFLPIVGMIEFNYGRNLDTYTPIERGETGARSWSFQFSLGQGFN